MALPERMKFGIFMGPFHRVGENPTLAIDRDLELVQWLDHLGFDEAWIGEHHSAGWETISSPELFMAVAADRTKHIKLGTGVISLPYHHPFMVANRMVQLDHMTHGRVMLGVGPGALQHLGHHSIGLLEQGGQQVLRFYLAMVILLRQTLGGEKGLLCFFRKPIQINGHNLNTSILLFFGL